jgi:hypothetical protein
MHCSGLASWIAEHFVIEHQDAMFDIVAANGLRLHPMLWWSISREIGLMKQKPLEDSALKRWITVLLASAPTQVDGHALLWLAERCASQGIVTLTLKVFLSMSEHRFNLKLGSIWHEGEDDERGRRLDVECPLA